MVFGVLAARAGARVMARGEGAACCRLGDVEHGGGVFNDHVLATAILDRLLHHATTLNIKGESYRLKEKRRAGLLGQVKPVVEEAKEVDLEVFKNRTGHIYRQTGDILTR